MALQVGSLRAQVTGRWFSAESMLGVVSLLALQCTPVGPVHSAPDAQVAVDAQTTAQRSGTTCDSDADCPTTSACADVRCESTTSACGDVRCERKVCVISAKLEGTVLTSAQQVPGDCRRIVCDGHGRERMENDDGDSDASDGNPCHQASCRDGKLSFPNMQDGMGCNGTGSCKAGECSVCMEGMECTSADACTVHQARCVQGKPVCTDTKIPEVNRACGMGKMCLEGRCITACQKGACMPSTDPCQTSHWDCADPNVEPECVPAPSADGVACSDDSHCHAGACSHSSLINGDFSQGLTGWKLSGDGEKFPLAPDADDGQRITISTSLDRGNGGGSARGTVSQSFVVPADALAIRFIVSGGHAHVRLRDANGGTLQDCIAGDSSTAKGPVSWDLTSQRGQSVTIAIEDDMASGDWAWISVSGFDVIRDVSGPIQNSQFAYDKASWDTSGDGARFNIFDDVSNESYGVRRSVSTYTRTGDNLYTAGQGTMSQTFLVPVDAVALRFSVHGGSTARVNLLENTTSLYSITAANSDIDKQVASWDMQPHRGKTLRLVIEDGTITQPFGYIGSTGFDLITSYNGP